MQSCEQPDCFITTSKGIAALSVLPTLLQAPVYYCRSNRRLRVLQKHFSSVVMIAWGLKPSAERAKQAALAWHLPIWQLEDGLLRSIGLGHEEEPLSIVCDDTGIYYDARSPSRLEQLVAQPWPAREVKQREERAHALISAWRAARVSKYNAAREDIPSWLDEEPFVLVVDQTAGDASIEFGLAKAEQFQLMLESAQQRFPQHRIVVKTHPDVMAGMKKAHFTPQQTRHRVRFLVENIHPPALLERAAAVFCVTSQMGFEALLWGKPTYTFGMPFYAGWGLTNDVLAAPARRQEAKPSLAKLISAALIEYPQYIHPETRVRCEVEDVLPWFSLQRQQIERFPVRLWAGRWPRWKKTALRQFLRGSELIFSGRRAVNHQQLPSVGWGAKAATSIRVEDGFIRSVGLGADLVQPQSWVIDQCGMYYDATAPSSLEWLLQNHQFHASERARADTLITQLIRAKVSKYNVGDATWQRPADAPRVILIPGQVESDASIQLGSPRWKSNLELIQQVRARNPHAYLVYKPHPDVQAGLRISGSAEQRAAEFVDEVVFNEDMAHLLTQVDEVHTLTSLTGFEALLRGIQVTCYGQPFYAGWGLTSDQVPPERRNRQLHLNELVAGALILYPTYISRRTGYFTTVEHVLIELVEDRKTIYQGKGWTRLMRDIRRSLQRFHRF